MMVLERGALRRETTVVSMRNCSSGKLANSGTVFRTAVDTGAGVASPGGAESSTLGAGHRFEERPRRGIDVTDGGHPGKVNAVSV